MDRVAVIIGNTVLYWSSVCLVLSAAAGVCMFLAFYLGWGGSGTAAALAVPEACVLSLFFARLVHWYFRPDGYDGFLAAMTDYTSGGYALVGVFLGCGLTALLLLAMGAERSPGRMLDAMSLGGCCGIAVGRLACFFSAADRGQIMAPSLPIAYPVWNAVTGAEEYRLATFALQAAAVGLIFLLLCFAALRGRTRRGDIAALFLLLYCLSQTILDSTRYDSLYLRSNGFIRVTQLASAVTFAAVCVIFSVRMVKTRGFRFWYPAVWLAMAALLAGAGYMEYYVQRHGDKALFSYAVMTECLCAAAMLALVTYARGKQ